MRRRFRRRPFSIAGLWIAIVFGFAVTAAWKFGWLPIGLSDIDTGSLVDSEHNHGANEPGPLDSTNPFAYLALTRHHLEYGSGEEASAFLDQARSLFEVEGRLGPAVDVWGIGLRAWIDRSRGRDASAKIRFEAARGLSFEIWLDEQLSAHELR